MSDCASVRSWLQTGPKTCSSTGPKKWCYSRSAGAGSPTTSWPPLTHSQRVRNSSRERRARSPESGRDTGGLASQAGRAGCGDARTGSFAAIGAGLSHPCAGATVRRRSRASRRGCRRGLRIQPNDPGLLELRGVLQAAAGDASGALESYELAAHWGALDRIHIHKAIALEVLGRDMTALREWSFALRNDPELPEAYLGRARLAIRLE